MKRPTASLPKLRHLRINCLSDKQLPPQLGEHQKNFQFYLTADRRFGRLGTIMLDLSNYSPRSRRKSLSSHREGRDFVLKLP